MAISSIGQSNPFVFNPQPAPAQTPLWQLPTPFTPKPTAPKQTPLPQSIQPKYSSGGGSQQQSSSQPLFQAQTNADLTAGTPLENKPLQQVFAPAPAPAAPVAANKPLSGQTFQPNASTDFTKGTPLESKNSFEMPAPLTTGTPLESKGYSATIQQAATKQQAFLANQPAVIYGGVNEPKTFLPSVKQMGVPLATGEQYNAYYGDIVGPRVATVAGITAGALGTPVALELFGRSLFSNPVGTVNSIPGGTVQMGKDIFFGEPFTAGQAFGGFATQAVIFGGVGKGVGRGIAEVKTLGKTYVEPSGFFDIKALEAADLGKPTYPKSASVSQQLKKFETGLKESGKTSKGVIVHTTGANLGKEFTAIAGSSETPGLYGTPYGKASPAFSRLVGGAEGGVKISLNPLDIFKGQSANSLVIETGKPVSRIPQDARVSYSAAQDFFGTSRSKLTKQGPFTKTELLPNVKASKGRPYITPAVEFGKTETEAILAKDTKLNQSFSDNASFWNKLTGSEKFTRVGGKPVFIKEYSAVFEKGVGDSSKVKVTTLGSESAKSSGVSGSSLVIVPFFGFGGSSSKPSSSASSSGSFVSSFGSSVSSSGSKVSSVISEVSKGSSGVSSGGSSSGFSFGGSSSGLSSGGSSSGLSSGSSSGSSESSSSVKITSGSSFGGSSSGFSGFGGSSGIGGNNRKYNSELPKVSGLLGSGKYKVPPNRRLKLQIKSSDISKVLLGESNITVDLKTKAGQKVSKAYFSNFGGYAGVGGFITQEEYNALSRSKRRGQFRKTGTAKKKGLKFFNVKL